MTVTRTRLARSALTAVPWLLLALGVARVVLTVALARTPAGLVLGNDFVDLGVYRVGADALLHGDSVYDRSYTAVLLNGQVQDPLPFNYPVFSALAMVPLALVPFWTAAALMVALGLASVAMAAWVLAPAAERTAGRRLPWSRPMTAVGIGGLLLALEPVTSTLEIGQVNLILMAAVLVDVFVVWRLSGLLTGLATGVKLTPAVFVLLMAVTRRGRETVVAVVTFLGTVAVGFLLQPGPAGRYWREFVLPGGTDGATSANNQSLVADVGRVPGAPSLAGIAVAGLLVAATLWLASVMWRFDRLLATVAVAVGGLLASPISWNTHWVWFGPTLVLLAALGVRTWTARARVLAAWCWVLAAGIFLLAALGPLKFLVTSDSWDPSLRSWAVANLYVIPGLLVLAVLAWATLRRRGIGWDDAALAPAEPSPSVPGAAP